MNIKKIMMLAAGGVAMVSTSAYADYYKVYSPIIEKNEVAFEANLNIDADHRDEKDNYLSQVYMLEYAATDWWKTEFGVEVEKENGEDNKLTNIKWENILAPFSPGQYWLDAALYLEVEKAARDHEPDNFETKLLLEKNFGAWVNTVNLGVSHEFGQNHAREWDSGLALRTAYRLDQRFEPGIEYYAEFGKVDDMPSYSDQEHKIGPVFYGKVGHVKYDAGVLFGVSEESSDTTAKLNLEYEF